MKILMKPNRVDILDERFYEVGIDADGVPIYYPSVTWILDSLPKGAGFEQWLKDVGNDAIHIANRAAEVGSLIHDTISHMLTGMKVTFSDYIYSSDMRYHGNTWTLEEWRMLLRFKEFWDEYDCELIASESIVIHSEGYAGTADIVCKIGDDIWLLDIKTGNDVYDSAYLQVAAYAKAWNSREENLVKINRIGIIHLRAKTRTRNIEKMYGAGWKIDEPKEDMDYLYDKFLSVLSIFRLEHRDRKMEPLSKSYPMEITLKTFEDVREQAVSECQVHQPV